jgi:beta-lactamase regulating signal transducer with metallopeptidase domain
MELQKNWFPLVLAAIWMVLCAAVLIDFAKFNAATSTAEDAVAKVQSGARHQVAGRRGPRPAAAIR